MSVSRALNLQNRNYIFMLSVLVKNATIMEIIPVDYHEFNAKYNERDSKARINMMALIDSDKNNVEKAFEHLLSQIFSSTTISNSCDYSAFYHLS